MQLNELKKRLYRIIYDECVEITNDNFEQLLDRAYLGAEPCVAVSQLYLERQKEAEAMLTELKAAKELQESGIMQPSHCFFGGGVCGYPIDDCVNCPVHGWNGGLPSTRCSFK